MTFEQYKSRLAEISRLLDNGDVSLEDSIKYFAESIKLSEECLNILNNKKGEITVLKNKLYSLNDIKSVEINDEQEFWWNLWKLQINVRKRC